LNKKDLATAFLYYAITQKRKLPSPSSIYVKRLVDVHEQPTKLEKQFIWLSDIQTKREEDLIVPLTSKRGRIKPLYCTVFAFIIICSIMIVNVSIINMLCVNTS